MGTSRAADLALAAGGDRRRDSPGGRERKIRGGHVVAPRLERVAGVAAPARAIGQETVNIAAEVALHHHDVLGECPLWDDRAQALWWVDIKAMKLHRWAIDGGAEQSWVFDEPIGSFAFTNARTLLLAMKRAVHRFDPVTGARSEFARPDTEPATNRFNDGRCVRRFDEIFVPNSLAFSPDDRIMYFSDTHRHLIWTCAYDLATGQAGERRIFSDLRERQGRPDGSAIDADGCLWNCEYGGGRVVRYTPDGVVDQVVTLPATNATCCAFGGADLRTLYITTATQRLTPEDLERQPLAGSVFAARVTIPGLPEARFGG